jgi:ABC-type oligopeptide transport system substrate-binding subunit
MTEKNSVTYVLNENYWAADQVNLKAVKLVFNDGSDVSRVYDDFINGNTVNMYLNASRIELAKKRGDFEKYAFVNDVGRISFLFWFNMHRQIYANMADGTAPSQKTDLEKEISIAALQNVHFRLAIGHSIDRASYLAQNVGEELKSISIRNTMTPGTYVKLDEPTTVKINGEDVTFDENTYYGAIVQAQLDADDFPVTVWDSKNETTDGWDAWYNPELAAQELALAIKDLKALGYDVSKENPIVIDYPYPSYNEVGQNQAYVLKTCIEGALGGLVRFDALPLNDVTEFLNVENNTNSGAEHNTDMGGLGCIGSDHGDPRCYLDGMLPYGDGAFTPRMGLW